MIEGAVEDGEGDIRSLCRQLFSVALGSGTLCLCVCLTNTLPNICEIVHTIVW